MDKYELYTLCVQDPPRYVRFLEAIHGRKPLVLRDDFAGAGAIAMAWAKSNLRRRAIAVDSDFEPLKRAKHPRVKLEIVDAGKSKAVADIITSLNFGVCELHTRRELVAYLKNALKTLKPGGVLVCDLYGGGDAFETLRSSQKHRGPRGEAVTYTWEQAESDQVTMMVRNFIHFRVVYKGKTQILKRAFSYHWRLWSIPELREAMMEAGFELTLVYDRLGSAIDQDGTLLVEPLMPGEPLDETWVAYCVGRKTGSAN